MGRLYQSWGAFVLTGLLTLLSLCLEPNTGIRRDRADQPCVVSLENAASPVLLQMTSDPVEPSSQRNEKWNPRLQDEELPYVGRGSFS